MFTHSAPCLCQGYQAILAGYHEFNGRVAEIKPADGNR